MSRRLATLRHATRRHATRRPGLPRRATPLRQALARLSAPGWSDRGSILPIIPVMALAMLMVAGLVIDASRQLNARSQAVAYAEEAARAGAQAVEPELPVALDRAEAEQYVGEYCSRVLAQPHVTSCGITGFEPAPSGPARPLVVVVSVRTEIPATLLGMVGVRTLTASGEGRAEPVEGVLNAPPPVEPEL